LILQNDVNDPRDNPGDTLLFFFYFLSNISDIVTIINCVDIILIDDDSV
jgi:hypothetical protein